MTLAAQPKIQQDTTSSIHKTEMIKYIDRSQQSARYLSPEAHLSENKNTILQKLINTNYLWYNDDYNSLIQATYP